MKSFFYSPLFFNQSTHHDFFCDISTNIKRHFVFLHYHIIISGKINSYPFSDKTLPIMYIFSSNSG